MKFLSFWLISITLNLTAAPATAGECQKVIASAHPAYPPYHWNDGGSIVGASVDIHKIIFSELGIPFDAKFFGPWKRVLLNAEEGSFDFVMALKKTPARQAYLNFTEAPVFPNPFSVFVERTSLFPFEKWEDLVGKTGGKNAGDRYGQEFDEFANEALTIEDALTPELNYKKLIAGRIDYFIHSRYSGAAFLSTFGHGHLVTTLDKNINEGYIHSGFSKNSSCSELLPYLNKRYKELLEDGTAERLLNRNVLRWKEFVEEKGQ